MPKKKSVVRGKTECPQCKRSAAFTDKDRGLILCLFCGYETSKTPGGGTIIIWAKRSPCPRVITFRHDDLAGFERHLAENFDKPSFKPSWARAMRWNPEIQDLELVEEVVSDGASIPSFYVPVPTPRPLTPPRERTIFTKPEKAKTPIKISVKRANMPESATIPLERGLEVRFTTRYKDEIPGSIILHEIEATIHLDFHPEPIGKMSMVVYIPAKKFDSYQNKMVWDLYSCQGYLHEVSKRHSEELAQVGLYVEEDLLDEESYPHIIEGPFAYLSQLEIKEEWRGLHFGFDAAKGLFLWLRGTVNLQHVLIYLFRRPDAERLRSIFFYHFGADLASPGQSRYYFIQIPKTGI
jgi:hypothetical protein